MDEEDIIILIAVIVIVVYITSAIWGLSTQSYYNNQEERLVVEKEVANDICFQLTGNDKAVSLVEDKRFICELPSFDHTQNIIVRNNSEG